MGDNHLQDCLDGIEEALKIRYEGWDGGKQFEGTSKRLQRMYEEFCWPPTKIGAELKRHLSSVFDDPYDEMLVSGPTSIWTLCPHHLLPCNFQVWIGYIPNNKVLGLSKFSRIAITIGKNPIMQEMYSRSLANIVMDYLKPEGVGVYVVGKHGCMGCRGVGQYVNISTSVLKGSFKEDPAVRQEFYSNVLGV